MLLKHDLHYSHKDSNVLSLLAENKIVTLFVPAGCTDILQEFDTVINKPFKMGMKEAFRDYVHKDFNKFRSQFPDVETSLWKPNFNVGVMKAFLPGFVEIGIATLKSVEMKDTIKTSFQKDGLFQEMRSEERYLLAKRTECAVEIDHAESPPSQLKAPSLSQPIVASFPQIQAPWTIG